MYSAIGRNTKLCIRNRCEVMRRSTPRFLVVLWKFTEELWKPSFSDVFRGASMDFHRITNQKPGDAATHNFESFSYTSLCGVINRQILNCAGSFDGGFAKRISVLALHFPLDSTMILPRFSKHNASGCCHRYPHSNTGRGGWLSVYRGELLLLVVSSFKMRL